MVHYHQQALQFIMFLDTFEVSCVTVDITNPVCKTCMILFIETSWPSPIQRFSSLFFFLFFFRTGIVMKSTSCSSYKKECPQWMYTIIYLKKPTSFSSDFALALSICLCFYFCNICIHVGIYCCLMSHTSLITSEISHRSGRVQLMKSFIVSFSLFFFVQFFLLRLSIAFFLRTNYQECF